MQTHQLTLAAAAALTAFSFGATAQAQNIVNPGGEAYDASAGRVLITEAGVDPLSVTGFQATTTGNIDGAGVFVSASNAFEGDNRLVFGAADSDPDFPVGDPAAAELFVESFKLFQETDVVAAEGDTLVLGAQARAFFQYDVGTDMLTSVIGYVDDGSGEFVPVDLMGQPTVITGEYTPITHSLIVLAGSPLIGEEVAIGFFNDVPSDTIDGAFGAVDNVSLVPEPASLALLGLGGLTLLRRRA